MKEKYLNQVPLWYKDNTKYDLVLSDDIDGLISTAALKSAKGWDVEYFYDFKTLYISDDILKKENKSATRVWADVSILKDEKTFDNHINRVNLNDYTNPNAINPNILCGITNQNYYKKYLGSTALFVWSIYGLPLPKTELGKMILLCIDTAFKGFYAYGLYKESNRRFLCDVFGMEELFEVLKHHEQSEFYELISKHNLAKKSRINGEGYIEGGLDTAFLSDVLGIPVELPKKRMRELAAFESRKFENVEGIKSVRDIPNVITLAFTGRNICSYSALKKKHIKGEAKNNE